MPDNTYTWVVMREGNPVPELVFQKKYDLRGWINGQSQPDTADIRIFRFPPYGRVGGTEVFISDILNK